MPASVTIRLAKQIHIEGFTIDHIDPQVAMTTADAPRLVEFYAVYGRPDEAVLRFDSMQEFDAAHVQESAVVKLMTVEFDPTGDEGPVQTFNVDGDTGGLLGQYPTEFVSLKVVQSHGEDQLCLYRVRVHGEITGFGFRRRVTN